MAEYKRFVMEFGFGVDSHGQDPTNACIKAVKDAISRVYIIGLLELNIKDFKIDALLGVPYPENVDMNRLMEAFPIKKNLSIKVIKGGLIDYGAIMEEFNDKNTEIIMAVASITVSVKI
ncbi:MULTISPECIES: Lin0512 family protein [Caldisericum]|jgi:uncharacterized protein (TIGR02058 family)|uniref:Uncharacterized protein n=1 Tax=Caldisericum exile TaxID=693075 RepID=A0A2J6X9A8_9BACT|nr:MAG: hypothetical protein C0189_00300 [Caldisericum exile]PMP83941.1 MAG: hypothetical protein C0175_00940 [Caldisericum exile]